MPFGILILDINPRMECIHYLRGLLARLRVSLNDAGVFSHDCLFHLFHLYSCIAQKDSGHIEMKRLAVLNVVGLTEDHIGSNTPNISNYVSTRIMMCGLRIGSFKCTSFFGGGG